MSAPLRPAAWTLTSTSPALGTGSGCSSITISFSRMVAARTRRSYPPAGGRLLEQHRVLVRVRGRTGTHKSQRPGPQVEPLVARARRDQRAGALRDRALLAVDHQSPGTRADEIQLLRH